MYATCLEVPRYLLWRSRLTVQRGRSARRSREVPNLVPFERSCRECASCHGTHEATAVWRGILRRGCERVGHALEPAGWVWGTRMGMLIGRGGAGVWRTLGSLEEREMGLERPIFHTPRARNCTRRSSGSDHECSDPRNACSSGYTSSDVSPVRHAAEIVTALGDAG